MRLVFEKLVLKCRVSLFLVEKAGMLLLRNGQSPFLQNRLLLPQKDRVVVPGRLTDNYIHCLKLVSSSR